MAITKEAYMGLREIKQEILKATSTEENVTVRVKIFDNEADEKTYDVEIAYYVDGQYIGDWVSDIFYGVIGDEEYNKKAEKEAMKRAKAVLKSVKGWYDYSVIEVSDEITVYHN